MTIKCRDLILLSILSSKTTFVVDESIFLLKSTLISVTWFMVQKEIIIAHRDFISLVLEQYRHSHTVELYRVLSIMTAIDIILLIYPYPSTLIKKEIGTDYLDIIHNLWNIKIIFSIAQHIHQIIREIYLIKSK